jgi:energy-coupling factor transport system substrate-specific component
MDKAIVFTIVAVLVYALPSRVRQQFPFIRRHRVLAGTTPSDAPAKGGAAGPAQGTAHDSARNG